MRYLTVIFALALTACGAPPTSAAPMDADAPDVQADAGSDTERLPDHCEDVVMGEYEARNESLKLDRNRASPDECHLTRGCEDASRLVHWCATECPATNDCEPGGAWHVIEYRDGWAVQFNCSLNRYCPKE